MNNQTREEAVEKLTLLKNDADTEEAHIRADYILLELINNEEVTNAYNKIHKWYA